MSFIVPSCPLWLWNLHTSKTTILPNEAWKKVEDMAAKREAADRLRKLEKENESNEKGESAVDFAAKMMRGDGDGDGDGDGGGDSKKR